MPPPPPGRRACPVCATALPAPFVERRGVPVLQNVLLDSAEAARGIARGDLVLAHCPGCDLVVNAAFDPQLVVYGEDYENAQVCSEVFEHYVDALVGRLVARGVRERDVVEVGCGSGYFLEKLCREGRNRGVGFDTAYRGPEQPAAEVRFVRDAYGAAYVGVPADVVVCRHVIEHVPEPLGLLGDVRAGLGRSTDALVVFETPALEWIVEGVVFQDFFYEHCSYFSARSLAFALRRAGFEPVQVERSFAGQYLWVEARPARHGGEHPPPGERLGPALERYRAREARCLDQAAERLAALRRRGPVAVWGAGAKGVTFVNLLDPACEQVACVVDVNPRKAGRFVAGTGHPVVGVGGLREHGVRSVLLMNPNYLDEARRLASEAGCEVELVTQRSGWA